jgi:hypothetical protein
MNDHPQTSSPLHVRVDHRHPGDGSGPQLHGWVTRMDTYGSSFVVEPARIEA